MASTFDPDVPDFTPEEFNISAAAKAALDSGQFGTFQALTGLSRDDARSYAWQVRDAVPPVVANVAPF